MTIILSNQTKLDLLSIESINVEVAELNNELSLQSLVLDEICAASQSLESISLTCHNEISTADLDGYRIALENYGLSLDELSIEGIKESVASGLKKFWELLKRSVNLLIKKVMDFFAKIFGGFKKLAKHISDVESAINDMEDKPRDPKAVVKIKAPQWVVVGDSPMVTKSMLISTNSHVVKFIQKMDRFGKDQILHMGKISADIIKANSEISKDIEKIKEIKLDPRLDEESSYADKNKGGWPFLAGYVLIPGKDQWLFADVRGVAEFTSMLDGYYYKGKDEMIVLPKNDLKEWCSNLAKMMSFIFKFEKQNKDIADMEKKVLKSSETFISTIINKKYEDASNVQRIRGEIRSSNRGVSRTYAQFNSLLFKYIRASLAAIKQHMAEYDKVEIKSEAPSAQEGQLLLTN